jgi:enolase-phosphatase E1
VTISLSRQGARVVLLDIEGTTTPVTYVYDVLFPYARARLREYLHTHRDEQELHRVTLLLHTEWSEDLERGEAVPMRQDDPPDARLESLAKYLEWLMDRDRKSPGLKLLQGRIWELGYRDGTLAGEVFPDVLPALQRWQDGGIEIAIYSSGSILAQRLLFATTRYGDLTRFIGKYFDTGVGPKRSPESYAHISAAVGRPPRELMFISDVTEELAAATQSGYQALLCVRDGPKPDSSAHPVIDTFDQVLG